jgi:Domain of unknown function (DUF4383)
MSIRAFASIAGILYMSAGILGFIPGITSPPPVDAPPLAVESSYGYLFGLFPVNVIHNLLHLGIGIWGFWAAGSGVTARAFARSIAVMYGLLAVMGVLPYAHTLFGFAPLFGHDIWLHAVTASIAGYFGVFAGDDVITVRRSNIGTDNVKVYEERPRL